MWKDDNSSFSSLTLIQTEKILKENYETNFIDWIIL